MPDKQKQEKEKKKGFIARIGNGLVSVMGVGNLTERVDDRVSLWKHIFRENRKRMLENLADREDAANFSFETICEKWGVNTPESMANYIRSKKQNLGVGIFLMFFGFLGAFWQNKAGVIGFLSSFSCISVGMLGIILALASYWRINVLKTRKFIPFEDWLFSPLRHNLKIKKKKK